MSRQLIVVVVFTGLSFSITTVAQAPPGRPGQPVIVTANGQNGITTNRQQPVAADGAERSILAELKGNEVQGMLTDFLSWSDVNAWFPDPRLVASATASQQEGLAASTSPVPRKDFNQLTADELKEFTNAVLEMMKLDCKTGEKAPACERFAGDDVGEGIKPPKDLSPIGWWYQASIHGALIGPVQDAWNTCEHSSWFFLSWHRMELYFFEKTIQAWSGDDKLGLPYWNFSVPEKDLADQCAADKLPRNCVGARLPAAFRSEKSGASGNPLYWPFRDRKANMPPPESGKPDSALPLCYTVVTTKKAFEQKAFYTEKFADGLKSFGGGRVTCGGPNPCYHPPNRAGHGQIEQKPHDMVHGAVGDGNALSLTNPAGAGLDPIFWPFHTNIDRAWACWQLKHPGDEPKEDLWLNHKFTFHYAVPGEKGKPPMPMMTQYTGKQIIDIAKQLNYTYGDEKATCQGFELPGADEAEQLPDILASALVAEPLPNPLIATAESPSVLMSAPVTVSINLPSEIQARIQELVLAGAPTSSIILTVDGLAVDRPSAAAYEVYLNLPQGVVPGYQDPYYIDELTFFGIGHNHSHMDGGANKIVSEPESISFDISSVVQQLVKSGEWRGNEVSVIFSANAPPDTGPKCVETGSATPSQRARFTSLTLTVN